MQSEFDATRAAESCVLADAERYMEDAPVERKCVNCARFCEIADTLGLSAGLDRALSFCGACERDGALYVVDRSNDEDIDECFEDGGVNGV